MALMVVSLPHALEDFHYGDLSRFGIPGVAQVVGLVVAYAIQLSGIALTARTARLGPVLLGLMGAIWCAGAILIHGHDLLFAGAAYRHGPISKLLEALIIVLGGAIAVIAAEIASRRTSRRR